MFRVFLKEHFLTKRFVSLLVGSTTATVKTASYAHTDYQISDKEDSNKHLNFNNYKGLPNHLIEKANPEKNPFDSESVHNLFTSQGFKVMMQYILNFDYKGLFFIMSLFSVTKKQMICEVPELNRPYLGCSLRERKKEPLGLSVMAVKSDSPAEMAGLRVNDLIVEVDGKKITNIKEYNAAIGSTANLKKLIILRKKEDSYESMEIDVEFILHQN